MLSILALIYVIFLSLIAKGFKANAKSFSFDCNYKYAMLIQSYQNIDEIENEKNSTCTISKNLKNLQITENNLKILSKKSLQNFPNLKNVDLNSNEVESIEEQIFQQKKSCKQ